MPAEGGERTFTEGEAYALVADAVARETAEAQDRVAALESENNELKNQIDVLATEKAAAEQVAEATKQEHQEFVDGLERLQAAEAKRSERVEKVKVAAPSLEISAERSNRIVAMSDEAFDEYVDALEKAHAKSGDEPGSDGKPTGLPRESAGLKGGTPGASAKGTVASLFAARRGAKTA